MKRSGTNVTNDSLTSTFMASAIRRLLPSPPRVIGTAKSRRHRDVTARFSSRVVWVPAMLNAKA